MLPITKNFVCYKGQTFIQNIYLKINEEPYDLNGNIARAQIRPKENSNTLIADFTTEVDGDNGRIGLILNANVTSEIHPGSYFYDLKTIDENDIVKYWLKGKFTVIGRITV